MPQQFLLKNLKFLVFSTLPKSLQIFGLVIGFGARNFKKITKSGHTDRGPLATEATALPTVQPMLPIDPSSFNETASHIFLPFFVWNLEPKKLHLSASVKLGLKPILIF